MCMQDYCEFNSLIANVKKLLKDFVVLLWRLRNVFPKTNNENNPLCGWEESGVTVV